MDAIAWQRKFIAFAIEANDILSTSDGAIRTRAYNVHDSLKRISTLSFDQANSLKEAVRCVESGLYRSAIVMAWTAIADLILILGDKEQSAVKSVRSRWKFTDKHSLAEEQGDYAVISALKEAKIITKSLMKSLHGLLHRRNQCAHPSGYFPGPNEALGYLDETIGAAKTLMNKI